MSSVTKPTRKEVNYVTAPLKLAMMLSEQPWDDISSDEDGVCEVVAATTDSEVMIDRCAAVLLSRIVTLVKSRGDAVVSPTSSLALTKQNKLNWDDSSSVSSSMPKSNAKASKNKLKFRPLAQITRRFTFRSLVKGQSWRFNSKSRLCDDAPIMEDIEAMVSKYERECKEKAKFPPSITAAVRMQIRDYVARIASWYQNVPYHKFEHATHVLLSANKLLFLLMTASEDSENPSLKHAYGLRTNFEYHLALIFAALVHDVDHGGVSNQTLINECDPLSILYNDQSVLEQRSLAVAFTVLMESRFEELRAAMFPKQSDFMEFRKVVIDLVMTTDIASGERMQIVKSKWKEAFGSSSTEKADHENPKNTINEKHSSGVGPVSLRMSALSLPSINEDKMDAEIEGNSSSQKMGSSLTRRLSLSPANSSCSSTGSGSESESENENENENENESEFKSGYEKEVSNEDIFAQLHAKHTSGVNIIRNKEGSSCAYQTRTISNERKSNFRRRTVDQFGSKSLTQKRNDLNDFDDRRLSLPVSARSSSGRPSISYRLGIKRAVTLSGDLIEVYASSKDDKLKAIVVMEWMMKAADVSSLMQNFSNFMKWSSRLYDEIYVAHRDGRGPNPADGWCENQITFFDSYIAQLAERLDATNVFGDGGSQFLENVHQNRERWILDGSKLTYELIEGVQERTASFGSIEGRVSLDRL